MLIKRNAMGRQRGFTLIELIVVMMILAILVATAAPKFLNFQVDARRAAVDGLKASIESAGQLVYGKAAIDSVEGSKDLIDVGPIGNKVQTRFGYPSASNKGVMVSVTGVGEKGVNNSNDWEMQPNGPVANSVIIGFKGSIITAEGQCYLTYFEATSASVPAKSVVTCVEPSAPTP